MDGSFEEIKDGLEESQSVKISQQIERLGSEPKIKSVREIAKKDQVQATVLTEQPKEIHQSSLEISIEQQEDLDEAHCLKRLQSNKNDTHALEKLAIIFMKDLRYQDAL